MDRQECLAYAAPLTAPQFSMPSLESHALWSQRRTRQQRRRHAPLASSVASPPSPAQPRWSAAGIGALVLLLSFAIPLRAYMLFADMTLSGDAKTRYYPLAANLLAGHGFSTNLKPPYQPNDFDLPGYPAFLTAILWVCNNLQAVVLVHLALELLTLFVMGRIMRRMKFSTRAQTTAIVLGLLCPCLPLWSARILTEVLATCLATLTCYALVRVCDEGTRTKLGWWMLAGVGCGLSLSVRPDMVLVVGFLILITAAVTWRGGWRQWARTAGGMALCGVAIALVLTPWTLRSYQLFGTIQPIGRVGDQGFNGYVKWLGTWVDDTNYQKPYWWDILKPTGPQHFPLWKLPTEERHQAERILALAKRLQTFDGVPSQQFMALTAAAKRQRPWQSNFGAPWHRIENTWNHVPNYMPLRALPLFATSVAGAPNRAEDHAVIILGYFWRLLSIMILMGLLYSVTLRQRALAVVFALILGRITLTFFSGLAVEARYMMEALPACFIFAALGLEAVWMLAPIGIRRLPALPAKLRALSWPRLTPPAQELQPAYFAVTLPSILQHADGQAASAVAPAQGIATTRTKTRRATRNARMRRHTRLTNQQLSRRKAVRPSLLVGKKPLKDMAVGGDASNMGSSTMARASVSSLRRCRTRQGVGRRAGTAIDSTLTSMEVIESRRRYCGLGQAASAQDILRRKQSKPLGRKRDK